MISWAGIATLAEADGVQEIEVEHLGHEGLARGQIYLRKAGANVRRAASHVSIRSAYRLSPARRCSASLSAAPMTQVAVRVPGPPSADADAVLFHVRFIGAGNGANGPSAVACVPCWGPTRE